jgi:hypothetical protein
MFGTSTANIKIESVWMRMLGSQTRPWLVSSILSYKRLSFYYFRLKLCHGTDRRCHGTNKPT